MYVVSLKRVVNCLGEQLKDEEQYFEYFQYDNYAGVHSTGYPCFGSLTHAKKFNSVEEAKETFERNLKDLKLTENIANFDVYTLAVRKITFHSKAKLKWS